MGKPWWEIRLVVSLRRPQHRNELILFQQLGFFYGRLSTLRVSSCLRHA